MRELDPYAEPLRDFMSADFYATRKELGVTQEQMAELLHIDWRSYIDLEHGKSLCCTKVFVLYVRQFKSDPAQFFDELGEVLDQVEEKIHA